MTALGLLMVSACSSGTTLEPGSSALLLPEVMMQGVPEAATLSWGPVSDCEPFDFGCTIPDGALTILSVHCDGCTLLEDVTNRGFGDAARIPLTATTDGAIELTVTVRFDPTGDTRTLTASSFGDHELGLEVGCKLLASNLAVDDVTVDDKLLRDCNTVRTSGERVVLFPRIRRLRRGLTFPFCPDDARCQGIDAPYRVRSMIAISPTPVGWGFSEFASRDEFGGIFAILPPYTRGEPITVSLPLFSGEILTSTIMGPNN